MENVDLAGRIETIKEGLWKESDDGSRRPVRTQGAVQATISVLSLIYGAPSQQLTSFLSRIEKGQGQYDKNDHTYAVRIDKDVAGVLDTALADLESGLTASVQLRAQGAVLGDFVVLAREALAESGDGPDRVAAVLAAAALEETLKQMGAAAGLDVHNRDMRGVIEKLIDGNVLKGAQVAIANGYVPFRNHAFHGQFEEIERASTESALAFVETLLVTEFS